MIMAIIYSAILILVIFLFKNRKPNMHYLKKMELIVSSRASLATSGNNEVSHEKLIEIRLESS